ncbi:MAG: TRAP transporter large permease subunit [Pseudomonadota bacterium]
MLTPILVPVAVVLGVDPIHFGVVMIMTLGIGEATAPFGMVLYVITKIARVDFLFVVSSTWPWLLALLAVIVLVATVPGLALWLPSPMRRGPAAAGRAKPLPSSTDGGMDQGVPYRRGRSKTRAERRQGGKTICS